MVIGNQTGRLGCIWATDTHDWGRTMIYTPTQFLWALEIEPAKVILYLQPLNLVFSATAFRCMLNQPYESSLQRYNLCILIVMAQMLDNVYRLMMCKGGKHYFQTFNLARYKSPLLLVYSHQVVGGCCLLSLVRPLGRLKYKVTQSILEIGKILLVLLYTYL